MTDKILRLEDLKTYIYTEGKVVKAVDGVDLEINKGEFLGLVGESGCGKSITAKTIMRILPENAKIEKGSKIYFEDKDIVGISDYKMQKLRGNDISMIFQDAMTSLNPVFTIGHQIAEPLMLHQNMTKQEAHEKSIEMLELAKIPEPEKRVNAYPHQLSGGMCQRSMIAMALACNPKLLLADEPTTALDVTVQKQILNLMNDLRDDLETSVLLITHDLGVVAETCDRVAVMYAGKLVEYAPKMVLFGPSKEHHPYTKGLLSSVPRRGQKDLDPIPGVVPDLWDLPKGCSFYDRCPYNKDICKEEDPKIKGGADHKISCHLY